MRSFPEETAPSDIQATEALPPLLDPADRAASSFANDLHAALAALWTSKQYGDVRLQARSGEEVIAHRLVITARCPYLAALLAAAPESASARLVVDAEREALEGILCYLYTDELPPDAPTEQVLRLRLQVASQAPPRTACPAASAPLGPDVGVAAALTGARVAAPGPRRELRVLPRLHALRDERLRHPAGLRTRGVACPTGAHYTERIHAAAQASLRQVRRAAL